MTQDEKDEEIGAAEYVLGVLSAEERATFEARLATDPALRAEVRDWTERLTPLAETLPDEPVPPRVYRQLEQRLFPAPTPLLGRLGFWRMVSFGAVAAAAILAVIAFTDPAPTNPAPTLVAQISGEAGVTVAALYDPQEGALRVNRLSGAAADGRALELWLIVGDAPPRSLGLLPTDSQGTLTLTIVALTEGILAISDEPAGGSPTGAPTGQVLAVGALSEV
ncbi:anti-sigma-K factor RskA [Rubricella aquisinus]|uniref:Regulator of SigK n=1 Tax=Rubricella aquisinus TaxID=2028108 RepID=A0A840WLW2_9RHOB|nr:anti-sigma factor [Rubricella aquisinus]MBB5516049.1 anti-sigma-K factor RskA [Rubricella aquisinus]